MPRTTTLPLGDTAKVTMIGIVTSQNPFVLTLGAEGVTVPAGDNANPVTEESVLPSAWPPLVGDLWAARTTLADPEVLFFGIQGSNNVRMQAATGGGLISTNEFRALQGKRLVWRQS